MKLGSPAAMSKEPPSGPADAPGHVGMSVADLEGENERLRTELKEAMAALAAIPNPLPMTGAQLTWFQIIEKERDDWKARAEAIWTHTCIHHTDAERVEASQRCPVCLIASEGKAIDFCIGLTGKAPDEIRAVFAERDTLRTQLAEAQKDAARLREAIDAKCCMPTEVFRHAVITKRDAARAALSK